MSRYARAFLQVSFLSMCLLAFVGAATVFGLLTAIDQMAAPTYQLSAALPPTVSARSWIIYDVDEGDVLYAVNQDEVLPIASLTKLPLAAVVMDHGRLDATTTIEWSDVATDGKAGRLSYGEVYTNRELLFPLLLESSNDAATTLSRTDSALLSDLNQYAANLQLSHTHFADPSGLSDQNVSTAAELMKLSRDVYHRHPSVFDITRIPAYYSAQNGWLNNNPLRDETGYLGGKHGFTYAANRTATAFFAESISGIPRTLGYVVLGSDDLRSDIDVLRQFVRGQTVWE